MPRIGSAADHQHGFPLWAVQPFPAGNRVPKDFSVRPRDYCLQFPSQFPPTVAGPAHWQMAESFEASGSPSATKIRRENGVALLIRFSSDDFRMLLRAVAFEVKGSCLSLDSQCFRHRRIAAHIRIPMSHAAPAIDSASVGNAATSA